MRNEFPQFPVQPLRPWSRLGQGRLPASGTQWRLNVRAAAVMAYEPALSAVVGERQLAVAAGHDVTAEFAMDVPGEAPPIEQDDGLFSAPQRLSQGIPASRREQLASSLMPHVHRLALGHASGSTAGQAQTLAHGD